MSELLTLIRVGDTPRMESLLHKALSGIPYEEASPQNQALHNRRILFVVGIDNQGPGTDFYRLVRWLRHILPPCARTGAACIGLYAAYFCKATAFDDPCVGQPALQHRLDRPTSPAKTDLSFFVS